MISKSLVELVNEQIRNEHYASNLYLQMSAWCEVNGLRGAAFFLKKHSAEEREHMMKLFSFLTELGHLARVGEIPAPPPDFASVEEVFAKALEHEKFVTEKINHMVDQALSAKDYATFSFLQWFIDEQREEEILFTDILDKIRMLSGDNRGLYFIDREIASLGAQS